MEPSVLEECQELLGHRFANIDLLALALTHASVAPNRLESNERLEFLGDSVLALVVCHELYDRQADLLEGDMTKVKSAVVSRQTCAQVSNKLGLPRMVSLGKGMLKPGALPPSVAAAVFETVIGAIYLDGGLAAAREFILRHISPCIQQVLEDRHQRNYKSLLQQHSQQKWDMTPEYYVLDEKGPDHTKCFEVAVSVDGRHFPSAWGKSKKQAEQDAARRALEQLGLLSHNSDAAEQPADQNG